MSSDIREGIINTVLFVIVFTTVLFGIRFVAEWCGYENDYDRGYIQCLADLKAGKQPKFKLEVQKDGTTKWVKVGK